MLNQTEIRLYLLIFDCFGTKQNLFLFLNQSENGIITIEISFRLTTFLCVQTEGSCAAIVGGIPVGSRIVRLRTVRRKKKKS